MTYGLIIVLRLKNLSESENRLFRKKRGQIMRKTDLMCIKNGVYLFPFANHKPSYAEVKHLERFLDLLRHFNAEADFYSSTKVELENVTEGNCFDEEGRLDMSKIKLYFVLKPLKVLRD